MDAALQQEKFADVNLADPFFDSLKKDYPEFAEWFARKSDQSAFTFYDEGGALSGFLYLKEEVGEVKDPGIDPPLPAAKRLKIGTFKIDAHGTKLGERFIKRAFDQAIAITTDALYVTVFPKHQALVALFHEYGFSKVRTKQHSDGRQELVLERRLDQVVGDVVLDYPRIPIGAHRHFVLALYPQWHSRLLPDSILRTERASILTDVSHTNSIRKIYLAAMSGVNQLRRGDTLLIYRTADGGSGYHTSVVTSLCVVESLTHISHFADEVQFVDHCRSYSIFTDTELRGLYRSGKYPWLIQFTYNLALTKRPNRAALIEDVGLDASMYFGFFSITTKQLADILRLSNDYEKARTLVYTSPLR